MNFLKKIDHYLLTNHPVLWRTKVHYFVLFSLILGNALAFSLGYFPIKWFGAINMNMPFMVFQILVIFSALIWLISQMRNKVKHYRFWDEALTLLVYFLCTVSLLVNVLLFKKTINHTTANLVTVEKLDEDKAIVDTIYDEEKATTVDIYVLRAIAKRYKVKISIEEKPWIWELSAKVNRIHEKQLALDMRTTSIIACGIFYSVFDRYFGLVFTLLFIPIIIFLASHTNWQTVLVITAVCSTLVLFSGVLRTFSVGIISMLLYAVLCLISTRGKAKINRFATLLAIPGTFIFSAILMTLVMNNVNFSYSLDLYLLVVNWSCIIIATTLGSAFFIKKHFEPTT